MVWLAKESQCKVQSEKRWIPEVQSRDGARARGGKKKEEKWNIEPKNLGTELEQNLGIIRTQSDISLCLLSTWKWESYEREWRMRGRSLSNDLV